MPEFDTIKKVFEEIKFKLNSTTKKKKIVTVYSFNGIGKTRLSNQFNEINNDRRIRYHRTLCYNAFLEDLFGWDNEEHVFYFDSGSLEAKLIKDEGLRDKIIDNFKDILNTKIEPSFNPDMTGVTFSIPSDENAANIKISRGEESAFIWVVFHTILQTAIDMLNEKEKDRSTPTFNKLKFIVIDDPVSSMDDTSIVTTAIKLVETIESYKDDKLKFLIMTHHPLFYNIFVNSFKD
ncbi:MAG: anticodon nuclease, partial [Candidatus Omnitrophica bacterium]|nr:anticodon nuclease [Candidatus Omnitrophota bacterium]